MGFSIVVRKHCLMAKSMVVAVRGDKFPGCPTISSWPVKIAFNGDQILKSRNNIDFLWKCFYEVVLDGFCP